MKEHNVRRDDDYDLRFMGESLGTVECGSRKAYQSGTYTNRWANVLTLYTTANGKFICKRVATDLYRELPDKYTGASCQNDEEVIAFFGLDALAKELYTECGIDDSVLVE